MIRRTRALHDPVLGLRPPEVMREYYVTTMERKYEKAFEILMLYGLDPATVSSMRADRILADNMRKI